LPWPCSSFRPEVEVRHRLEAALGVLQQPSVVARFRHRQKYRPPILPRATTIQTYLRFGLRLPRLLQNRRYVQSERELQVSNLDHRPRQDWTDLRLHHSSWRNHGRKLPWTVELRLQSRRRGVSDVRRIRDVHSQGLGSGRLHFDDPPRGLLTSRSLPGPTKFPAGVSRAHGRCSTQA
jgi:hypothetical protein